ncbi:hypothetical protein V8E36_006866 [Tilletia maclaganii]
MVFLAPQQHCLGRALERSAVVHIDYDAHPHQLALFASLILAAGVRSYNSKRDDYCKQMAAGVCHRGSGTGYEITYSQCMAQYWKRITTNKNCPHPKVNCFCYNGCVSDRSGIVPDVGEWCTAECRRSLQTSPCRG